MLWLDKYRPHSLGDMKFHTTLNQQLLQLASPEKVQSLPHLLFYGPSGAGKKARVSALLRAVYGPGADKVKVDMRNFKISGGKVVDQGAAADGVELAILSSSFHVEMSPSDVGPFKDRLVTQAVVKEMAQSNMPTGAVTFKIVVLNDVDELSRDAQAALRRTMEKYSSTCRFILVSQNPCRVIDPLRSRCIALRVPAPSVPEVQVVLQGVASAEHVELPAALYALFSHTHSNHSPSHPCPLTTPPRISSISCCLDP
jgi:replication factor C subunit 3/5